MGGKSWKEHLNYMYKIYDVYGDRSSSEFARQKLSVVAADFAERAPDGHTLQDALVRNAKSNGFSRENYYTILIDSDSDNKLMQNIAENLAAWVDF